MELIDLSQLWTAAAVLTGFQVTALSWRIKRELDMESRSERTWLTSADLFAAVSLLVVVFGVFAAPIFGAASTDVAAKLLGIALVLFTSSMFVLAGHYDLYCRWGKKLPRDRTTRQEWAAIGFSLVILAVYGAWWGLA